MDDSRLSVSAETLERDRVKLRVEVPEDALRPALDAAYRRWSQQIKVAGFRKGKVPRQIIDARVGRDTVRSEALEDALPGLYRESLRLRDLEPIAPPEIDIVSFEPGSPLVFEATVDVRPEVRVPDPATLRVEAPSVEVTDEDIDSQLERLRERFAELETVGRPARSGDYVLIDLKGYIHDREVEAASRPDLLYELGSRSGPPKLDDELENARPGEILRFTDRLPEAEGELADRDISFTVLVKEVKAKKLPPLDDELAKTMGEFDTLEELKADLRSNLEVMKRRLVEEQVRAAVLEELVKASDLEPPARLVEDEFQHRLGHLEEDLKRSGMTIADYAAQTQITELELRRDLRDQAARAVKAELLLEQVARDHEIEVTEEDIGREVALLAARSNSDPQELARRVAGDRSALTALASEVLKRKALDHLVEHADVIGRPADDG